MSIVISPPRSSRVTFGIKPSELVRLQTLFRRYIEPLISLENYLKPGKLVLPLFQCGDPCIRTMSSASIAATARGCYADTSVHSIV